MVVIQVDNLSKKFMIPKVRTGGYLSLREEVTRRVNNLVSGNRQSDEEFYALSNVSFNVLRGDRVGIIGRNGAGKSTLLKILSRITEPTSGQVKIKGRVASLLEVGTGFHPELTGRENVYLNGSILGMGRSEINARFDEIVDFAEVSKFLDTPVKRYSSGMYVRLAFAIAAHLEPDILIVDEILAVGDAQFQRKCLGKIEDVSKNQGRTVLFVSHQLGLISQLCNKGVLLKEGKVIYDGGVNEAVKMYIEGGRNGNEYWSDTINSFFLRAFTVDPNGEETDQFGFDSVITVQCKFRLVMDFASSAKIGISIVNSFGAYVTTSVFELNSILPEKSYKCTFRFPAGIIAPNTYTFRLALFSEAKVFEVLENVCPIRIVDTGSALSKYEGINYGNVILNVNCEYELQ